MEKQFVDGLIFKAPNEKAPDFIKGSLSIKVEDFTKFLKDNDNNGWVNIDLKESKGGKYYAELNTWKPEKKGINNDLFIESKKEDPDLSEIPF